MPELVLIFVQRYRAEEEELMVGTAGTKVVLRMHLHHYWKPSTDSHILWDCHNSSGRKVLAVLTEQHLSKTCMHEVVARSRQ